MTATSELTARLRRHYIKPGPMPGGIFIEECGQNGSWGAGSRCDALHVGFTSASGRILTGHEIKVSRSDWLTELNKPGKADTWADQCHAWYLVTATPDIVHDGELPPGWGHMVPGKSKTRMQVLVKPTVDLDRTPSWGAVRSIMARLDTLQRLALDIAAREHQAAVNRDVEDELQRRREVADRLGRDVAMTDEQRERLSTLDRLEQQLGITLDRYNRDNNVHPDDMAAALALVRAARPVTRHRYDVQNLERGLVAFRELVDAAEQYLRPTPIQEPA